MSKWMMHLYMKQRSVFVCSEDDDVICIEDSVLPLHPLISDDQPATVERREKRS